MSRYSNKPFSSLWNSSWNEKVSMDIIDEDILKIGINKKIILQIIEKIGIIPEWRKKEKN